MDEMSWKVVRAIFERGVNVLILCGSRPPSTNPLSVDLTFWAELHTSFYTKGRFIEIDLQPLSDNEVRDLIAASLDVSPSEIEVSFWRNLATATGGMPHFLSKCQS
jgi:predicted ATPase